MRNLNYKLIIIIYQSDARIWNEIFDGPISRFAFRETSLSVFFYVCTRYKSCKVQKILENAAACEFDTLCAGSPVPQVGSWCFDTTRRERPS